MTNLPVDDLVIFQGEFCIATDQLPEPEAQSILQATQAQSEIIVTDKPSAAMARNGFAVMAVMVIIAVALTAAMAFIVMVSAAVAFAMLSVAVAFAFVKAVTVAFALVSVMSVAVALALVSVMSMVVAMAVLPVRTRVLAHVSSSFLEYCGWTEIVTIPVSTSYERISDTRGQSNY